MSTKAWARLLHCLTIPTLSSLSIGSSTLLITDLTAFISRHPGITYLDVCDGILCIESGFHCILPRPDTQSLWSYSAVPPGHGYPTPSLMHLSFPLSPPPPHIAFDHGQLTSLLASPAHVAYLLAMRSKKGGPHIMPNLLSITIKPFQDFGYSAIDCALDMLSRSSLKDVSLTLWMYFTPHFSSWLRKFSETEDDDVTHNYWMLLHCVRRLRIQSLLNKPIGLEVPPLIPLWLAKLPSVEQVTFSTPCFAWMGSEGRKMLEAEIISMCPQMNEISVYSRM